MGKRAIFRLAFCLPAYLPIDCVALGVGHFLVDDIGEVAWVDGQRLGQIGVHFRRGLDGVDKELVEGWRGTQEVCLMSR